MSSVRAAGCGLGSRPKGAPSQWSSELKFLIKSSKHPSFPPCLLLAVLTANLAVGWSDGVAVTTG